MRISQKTIEKILNMYNEGMSTREISDKLSINEYLIVAILEDHGVTKWNVGRA